MADGLNDKQEFINLYNEIIQRQTVVLGPDIAVIIGRKVEGLKFSEVGKVEDYEGDPQELLQKLINGYVNLSGLIVRKTIEPLLAKHPATAAKVVVGAAAATNMATAGQQDDEGGEENE